MNDFLTDEEKADQLSQEEEMKIRQEAQDFVFNGNKPENPDKVEIDEELKKKESELESKKDVEKVIPNSDSEKETPTNESKDIPEELMKKFDALTLLNSTVSNMENRLKQTESRLGGINSKLAETKKKPKEKEIVTPSKEEISKAAESSSGWDDLSKEFPDWAKGIEDKILEKVDNFVSKEDIADLRKEFESNKTSIDETKKSSDSDAQLEVRLVNLMHPDWKTVVKSPDYNDWLKGQDITVLNKANHGKTAEEAIEVLNLFKASKAPNESSNEIADLKQKRENQLKSTTTEKTKHKTIKSKSEEDMNETELREKIASEVFAT